MKSVRAKFKCTSVEYFGNGVRVVNLSAVTGGSKENESFWKYTPSGELKMQIDNPPASDMFIPKKEYYLDISEAD